MYGVSLGLHSDGKAGMACIVPVDASAPVPLTSLYTFVENNLPPYARPVFLRWKIAEPMVHTTTFKQQKLELCTDGFARHLCGDDQLFIIDSAAKSYVPLTDEMAEQVVAGSLRV